MKEEWMQTFIAEQELYAQHATCADIYVSALIIDESHPTCISQGYNGTPHGLLECEELDAIISHLAQNYNQDQLPELAGENTTFSDMGKKVIEPFIGKYKDYMTREIIRRQIFNLTKLDKEIYQKLPDDVQLRLKFNVVHYRYEIHAEVNALNKLKCIDLSDRRYSLMVNYSPCFECAKNIISRGLTKVYFRNEWIDPRWNESSLYFLRYSGVELIHY